MEENSVILVTGASGMIGSHVVNGLLEAGYTVVGIDRNESRVKAENYFHKVVDLANKEAIIEVLQAYKVKKVVHLAALAHAQDGSEFTWEDYYHLNVECAKNVFDAAADLSVLFISTVDVFGFTDGLVDVSTPVRPVSNYAKSKVMAEKECQKLASFDIFRLSPVYTDTVKRDIQKRYYLKYPNIAYKIGDGTEYEILNIKNAVKAIVAWCGESSCNKVRIIKDEKRMFTPDYIKAEKAAGRASIVLWFPKWLVNFGYYVLKGLTGENKYTYLINKAVHPLRSE